MRKTIAQKVMKNVRRTAKFSTGTYSFRKNSNLYRKLAELGLTEDQVDVRTAARAGQHWNDGYQLLIFSKGGGNE